MNPNQTETKQIAYYGPEVAELLDEALKIVTLRWPNKKYDIESGERVVAHCPDSAEDIEMVVVDNTTQPLNQFSPASLLLDGYMSPELAAEDLGQYYDEVDAQSVMQRIATLPDYVWDGLSKEEQRLFLKLGLDGAMKEPVFRRIFMPALFFWFAQLSESEVLVQAWYDWLVDSELVDREEIETKMNVDPFI